MQKYDKKIWYNSNKLGANLTRPVCSDSSWYLCVTFFSPEYRTQEGLMTYFRRRPDHSFRVCFREEVGESQSKLTSTISSNAKVPCFGVAGPEPITSMFLFYLCMRAELFHHFQTVFYGAPYFWHECRGLCRESERNLRGQGSGFPLLPRQAYLHLLKLPPRVEFLGVSFELNFCS